MISGLRPRRYYQVNKNTFDVLFSELSNIINFVVLEFQRLFFAEQPAHTAAAFIISFIAYKLARYIPLWGLGLMGTIMAFSIPPLYLRNQGIIDQHILQAQNMAAEKAALAREMAGEKVGVMSDKAKSVTSEWGKKAGVELPWSPSKTSSKTTANTGKATGIEGLQELNVPHATPQKKVDPAKLPLPVTPAPVAQ